MSTESFTSWWITLIIALAGWIATIIAAVVGARLGGKYVKDGVLLAAKEAHEAERNRLRREIGNLRKALLAEIEALLERYMEGIGRTLEEAPENQPFLMIYPTYQRYFVVFEENVHLIGQIPDDQERELIVQGYTLAKGLLDSYKLNSSMTEKHNYAVGLGPVILGNNYVHVQNGVVEMMRSYTPILKKMHFDMLSTCDRLRKSLKQPIDWHKYDAQEVAE